jgi:hypothetical protein
MRAMVNQPTAPIARNEQILAAAEDHREKYDEKNQRQAAQDLDQAHHQVIGPSADITRDRPIA